MLTIYKYSISVKDEFSLKLPDGAVFLSIQCQRGEPQAWFLVDPRAPVTDRSTRKFRVFGTGNPVPREAVDWPFLGTFQMSGGDLIWHLFEVVSARAESLRGVLN